MLGLVRSKYQPGGLYGCEGAAVFVVAFSSFRSAVARAVWSKKLPMTKYSCIVELVRWPLGI